MAKPNILLIMADQFRFDATGLNGGWVRTPHLDRIASEGLNFRRCYTTSPVCMPARISMATGLYPHNTNLWTNRRYFLPDSVPVWTSLIRDTGYRTGLFGKTHLYTHSVADLRDNEAILRRCGLDTIDEIPGPRAASRTQCHMTARWQSLGLLDAYRSDYADRFAHKPHVVRPSVLPLEEYADVYVADRAVEYLSEMEQDAPWFCWLSFGGPHEPWDTPEPYASMYDPDTMPLPTGRATESAERARGHLDRLYGHEDQSIEYESSTPSKDVAPNHAPDMTLDEIRKMRADYAGNVSLIDDQIGRVLDVIETRGELQNTVIVFTSDHGEMNGDHGLIYKENFLDPSVRVPLIVRTPATVSTERAAVSVDSPVEWFDVGPTLAEIAGAEVHYRQFAQSLVPLLEDHRAEHRPDAISEIWGETMIVTGRWKMVVNARGLPYMLFDLVHDPDESRNLAGVADYRDTETALRLRLLERISESYVNERN